MPLPCHHSDRNFAVDTPEGWDYCCGDCVERFEDYGWEVLVALTDSELEAMGH